MALYPSRNADRSALLRVFPLYPLRRLGPSNCRQGRIITTPRATNTSHQCINVALTIDPNQLDWDLNHAMIRISLSKVDLISNSEYVDSRDRRCGAIKRAGDPVSAPVPRSPWRASLIAWSEVSLQSVRDI
jgi:hypothetical protein